MDASFSGKSTMYNLAIASLYLTILIVFPLRNAWF